MMLRTTPLVAIAVLLFATSCDRETWDPDDLLKGSSERETAILARGRDLYGTYCVGCHGAQGDGEGPAARFLSPKPRDLRKAKVKFAAVPSGSKPRDADLIATMDHGLRGTSMPSWRLLPADDKQAIVAYIKTFSEAWAKEPNAVPAPIKPDPFRKHPDRGVEEGERVYHGIAGCASCHPAYVTHAKVIEAMKAYDIPFTGFRADMYRSVEKDSEWGGPIKPPDFLSDLTKRASTKEELAEVISAGVGGTAMPSWGESLTDRQLWGLAYYVESLIQKRGTPEAKAIQQALDAQPAEKDAPQP